MSDTSGEVSEDLYWSVTDEVLDDPRVERGTMMGFPCLRVEGQFFASFDPKSHNLVVKLPADRVDALVEDGIAESFAPNGRRFKEWAAVPTPDRDRWESLIADALEFCAP